MTEPLSTIMGRLALADLCEASHALQSGAVADWCATLCRAHRRLDAYAAELRRERDELKDAADRLSDRAHDLEGDILRMQDSLVAMGEERNELAARLARAHDALEEIALAGMSGSGQESPEGLMAWHAGRAFEFIGIAARARWPEQQPAPAPERAEPTDIEAVLRDAVDRAVDQCADATGQRAKIATFVNRTEIVNTAIDQIRSDTPNCRCGPDGCSDSSCPRGER